MSERSELHLSKKQGSATRTLRCKFARRMLVVLLLVLVALLLVLVAYLAALQLAAERLAAEAEEPAVQH